MMGSQTDRARMLLLSHGFTTFSRRDFENSRGKGSKSSPRSLTRLGNAIDFVGSRKKPYSLSRSRCGWGINMGSAKTPEKLSTAAAAELLSVTPATVRLWANKELLQYSTTPGGHRRFDRREIEGFARRFGLGPGPSQSTSSETLRILVVDDERRVADYIARQLRDQNPALSIRVAYGGLEAGFEIREFRPNVIVVDLMMPEVDGVKVCELAKRHRADVRIIAITGFTNTPEESAILEAGAEACLHKPIDLRRLMDLIGVDPPLAATSELARV